MTRQGGQYAAAQRWLLPLYGGCQRERLIVQLHQDRDGDWLIGPEVGNVDVSDLDGDIRLIGHNIGDKKSMQHTVGVRMMLNNHWLKYNNGFKDAARTDIIQLIH